MPQVIQIKRTTGEVGNKKLHKGELAYSSYDDKLYIGRPDDSVEGNVLGTDPPVVIGGEAYTKMLTPSVSSSTVGSIKLGDGKAFDEVDEDGDPIADEQQTIAISSHADVTASYEIILPDTIGAQDQVLSVTNNTTSSTSASLGWIDVTSTIEGADDSLVTAPTNGQVLIYTTDMDGPLLSYTIHDIPTLDTQITNTAALADGWSLDPAGTQPVVGDEANGTAVYLQMGTDPGWINKTLTGEVTIGSDGATSITGTGSQTVKDFIEAADSLVLLGDLTVKGDTTHVNSNVVAIQDKNLALGITGGMKTVTDADIGTDGIVTIVHTQNDEELAQGEFVYIGDGNDNIPVGTYAISSQSGTDFKFIIPGFTVDDPILDQTISFSSLSVTDTLATGAGIIIPGDTGLKSITYDGIDSFVSNQSLDIVSDVALPLSYCDPTSTQTLSVDGVQIA